MKTLFKKSILIVLVVATLLSCILPANVLADDTIYTIQIFAVNDKNQLVQKSTNVHATDEEGVYSFAISEKGKYVIAKVTTNVTGHTGGATLEDAAFQSLSGDIASENMVSENVEVTYMPGTMLSSTHKLNVYELEPGTYTTSSNLEITNAKGSAVAFSPFEKVLSWIIRTCANGIVGLVNWAVGGEKGVTIDDIIFNKYPPTRLFYFGVPAGEETPAEDSLISTMITVINKWAAVFTEVAIVVYLAALLYIGIQIVMKSTAQKRADYQRFIVDWFIGIGLLFFFPVIIKYSIELNDMMVAEIEKGKSEEVLQSNATSTDLNNNLSSIGASIGPESTKEEINSFINAVNGNPFSNDTNYMAQMKKKADSTKKLSYAIVYIIMAWQLLMIVIVYYRRLFTVGFLLVLFPLVAMTYAIDKVKDGKSQAFDRWGKEIFLNIFLQTFHAIIYVFALNASFAAGNQNDWILMIIGISFLFKGEEIIRNIFGQKGDSAPSLVNTAVRTAAIYSAVTQGVSKLRDNFIGKNSHLGRAYYAHKEAQTYEMMADNFDMIADTGAQFRMPPASALRHAPDTMDDDATDIGNAIQTVNNRRFVSNAALASAISKIQNYDGAHKDMLKDLNVDVSKLDKMQEVKQGALQQLMSGESEENVEQNIRIEMESLFGADGAGRMEQALLHEMRQEYLKSNHKNRNTDRDAIKEELEQARARRQSMEDSSTYSTTGHTSGLDKAAKGLLLDLYGQDIDNENMMEMARRVAILRDRGSGRYSARQQLEAAKYVLDHKDDNTESAVLSKYVGENIEDLHYSLADKFLKQYVGEDYSNDQNAKLNTKVPAGVKMQQVHKEHYAKAIEKACDDSIDAIDKYNSTDSTPDLDRISVMTLARNTGLDDDSIVEKIRQARIEQNTREAEMLRKFAEKFEEKPPAPTFNGMTQSQIRDMAEAKKQEVAEEAVKSVAETGGAIMGMPIGAAAGIAFADTESGALVEGAVGAFAGAVAGDQLVAGVVGGNTTKDFYLKNPYTGEEEKVTLKVGGAFENQIYTYDDPQLPEDVRASIRTQFIKTAAEKKKKEDAERDKKINDANKRNGMS